MTRAAPPANRRGLASAPVCRVVIDLAEAEDLVAEWDELADAQGAGPMSRPAYALAWWRGLGRGRLAISTVRCGGRLVALAPLHERHAGPVTVVRWLGHGLGTVGEALVHPDHPEAASLVWHGVTGGRRVLDLVESRDGSPALAGLAVGSRRRPSVVPRDRCPVITLSGDGTGHLAGSKSRNLRYALGRADRDLAAEGVAFDLEVVLDVARFEEVLPEVRAVHDAAERAHPRQHLLAPPYESFVLAYVREELAAGRAAVLLGRIGGTAAAFKVVLLGDTTMSVWLMRHHPDAAHLRPGHLLFRAAYRWAVSVGLTRVDLLLGESQTKGQWSDGHYVTLDVRHGAPLALAVSGLLLRAASATGRVRRGPGPA